jgi:hypothetical protein
MRRTLSLRPSSLRRKLLATAACASLASPASAAWLATGNPVCTEPHSQNNLSIASDQASGAIVTWQDDRFGNIDVFAQRVDSSGVRLWTAQGVPVCTESAFQNAPFVVAGPDHGAFIVWQDARLTGEFDVFAQRLSATGTPIWTSDGIALSTAGTNQGRPAAIGNGAAGGANPRGWIAAYLHGSSGDNEVKVQHVNEHGTGLWTTPASGGVRLAYPLSNPSNPRLVTDGTGTLQGNKGAIVVWTEVRSVANASDVYARRVDNAGTPQWMANGVAVCDRTGDQHNADLVHVANGSVIVVWDDQRTANRDIYAQMVDVLGAPQWIDDGLPVCQATGAQSVPRVVTDGGLGAIIVWTDDRDGVSKVYAQRIDVAGQRLWGPDGVPVCTAPGTQTTPVITADGAGGAIVAWADRRSGDADVYAQRLDGNGNRLWGLSGSPLGALAASNQLAAQIVSDGKFGALVVWGDFRSGTSDLYVNRAFAPRGNVDVEDELAPGTVRLALASSHPASGAIRMRLDLPAPAAVTLDMLDVVGRRVQSSGRTERLPAGSHVLTWDGRDDAGAAVPPGIYFAEVRAGDARRTLRVVQVR